MLHKDGFYICHSPEGRALVIVSQNHGRDIWLREFATHELALNALEDDVLEGYDRADIEAELKAKRGFFTSDIGEPDENLARAIYRRVNP